MDEMEISISLKSIKIAWLYTVVFLFIWVTYDWIQNKNFSLPFMLLISQNMVYLGTNLFLKWKINKDGK